ncbi:hypothetical protein [Arthrospiribacter ruber]|uniref:Uncharacterized protein n=1 Tax=Arthrospiribacter ruber TaxID=2487934 RepID=A0A951IYE9_9BACT|nr:hypothetical protein [Arthrospiribacter ruber]MBW3469093.1 hypothetical protein [Arthrospiribacter ruber]
MKTNNNFKYDLEIGKQAENLLGQLLEGNHLEVKFDKYKNNRFFIEVFKRKGNNPDGSPKYVFSGLGVTQAEFYALMKNNIFIIIKTSDLKKLIKHKVNTQGNGKLSSIAIGGGDGGRSYGVLVTVEEIIEWQANNRTYKESIIDVQPALEGGENE